MNFLGINTIWIFNFFLFAISITENYAQLSACPNGLVYMHTNPIKVYNPALPLSASNPSNTTISSGGTGLAYGPNLSGGFPSPTFYTTISNVYYYWNGSAWVSTGHSTGTTAAVNIGVGPGCLYNLIGSSGQIWTYNGTGTGTYLTTISGFSGGGPYDLVVDECCNFYILKTTSPQSLQVYSPTGVLLASCTLSGMGNYSAGGGFAIVGNQVVVGNSGGLWVGTASGSNISFTNVSTSISSGGDFASCPIACGSVCYLTLPIEFASFTCETLSNSTLLKWSTAMEENITEFLVERSDDGINFETISRVTANNKASDYLYNDQSVLENTIYYYRITSVENSEPIQSTSICVANSGKSPVQTSGIFPNPGTGEYSLFVHSQNNNSVTIRISDPLGRIIKTLSYNVESGSKKIFFSISELNEGIYFFELTDNNNQLITKQKFSLSR